VSLSSRATFLGSFLLSALAALTMLGGGAWLAARALVGPPAERMRTSVFEFELAPGWACVREGTEHVCRKGSASREAVAIMTMKERGPTDTVGQYLEHLSTPQTVTDRQGRRWSSRVIRVQRLRLGGREWIVGRHHESEVRGYTTDYYAALTSHKAILVTFSVHQDHVEAFAPEFARMVASLKVFQD
jgi:hypothetical protein